MFFFYSYHRIVAESKAAAQIGSAIRLESETSYISCTMSLGTLEACQLVKMKALIYALMITARKGIKLAGEGSRGKAQMAGAL
jgi:hypothetical protein